MIAADTVQDCLYPDEPAPYDESGLLACPPLDARTIAEALPLDTRFVLGDDLTPVQHAFVQAHGFLVFAGVLSRDEVATVLDEMARVERKLIDEGIRTVNGVPVWFGCDAQGAPWLQRMGFSSVHSPWLEALVTDTRFEPIRRLIGEDARIATREKDGVVFNRYVNRPGTLRPDLPWHTDALRDVFYNGEMPGPMLNVGLHFDRIGPGDGGLRILPGSHTQSAWSTLTHKLHFVSNDDDPREVAVQTWPGDVTVHDGRMWHRVKRSTHTGARSIRHSMYVPFVIDAHQPKDERSKTNLYMRVFDGIMRVRSRRMRRKLRSARSR